MSDIIRPSLIALFLLMLCSAGLQAQHGNHAQHGNAHAGAQDAGAVPPGLIEEHRVIHEELAALLDVPGEVGSAAQELAELLHHHFPAENQLAIPPLGWLVPLASGSTPPGVDAMIAKTDSLRAAMPQMLAEHRHIHAAAKQLRAAGVAGGNDAAVVFAEKLLAHAQHEEEVLYPAAILVGDLLRERK
ncbi:MAG: hemerythrin domain-containing protein [Bacteroidota bacterium]|nr:hemerythrin domain-containing protein [Bacteroidota bacterium]